MKPNFPVHFRFRWRNRPFQSQRSPSATTVPEGRKSWPRRLLCRGFCGCATTPANGAFLHDRRSKREIGEYIQFPRSDPAFRRKSNCDPGNLVSCLQARYSPIPTPTVASDTISGTERQAPIVHLATKGVSSGESRIVTESASSRGLLVAVYHARRSRVPLLTVGHG